MLLVSDPFVVWTTPEKIETKFGNTRFFVPQNIATNKALVRSAEWAKEAAGLFYNVYLVVGKLICVVFIIRQLAKVTICSRNVSLGAKTLLGLFSISCTTFCMETATRVWMSDVDTANHTFNVFKIAEDGFKEVQKKDMEEAASHKMLWWRMDYASTLLFLGIGFLEVLRKTFVQSPTTKRIMLWRKPCCSFQVLGCRKESLCSQEFLSVINGGGATFVFNAGDVEAASLVSRWVVSQFKSDSWTRSKIWGVDLWTGQWGFQSISFAQTSAGSSKHTVFCTVRWWRLCVSKS